MSNDELEPTPNADAVGIDAAGNDVADTDTAALGTTEPITDAVTPPQEATAESVEAATEAPQMSAAEQQTHTDMAVQDAQTATAGDNAQVDAAEEDAQTAADEQGEPHDHEQTTAPKRHRPKHLWAKISGTIIALLGVSVVSGVVVGSIVLPLPSINSGQRAIQIVPDTTLEQRVCMGGVRNQPAANADDSGKAVAAASINSAVKSAGIPALVQLDAKAQPLAGGTAAATSKKWLQLGATKVSGAAIVQSAKVTAQGGIAGMQTVTANTANYAGTAITACADPTFTGWLVGGSTTTGRNTVLQITNPTSGTAKVSMQTYGAQGSISDTTEPISVAPHSTRVVSLVAYAPDADQLAVQYTSTGAPVVAFLQQSTVRGLTAGGVSATATAADPAKSQVISGIRIATAKQQSEAANTEGYNDSNNVLRLVTAGNGSKVNITFTNSAGKVTTQSVQMSHTSVTDVDLSSLSDGVYTAQISADQAVVAAARTTTGGTTRARYSWISSVTPQSGTRLLAAPTGVDRVTLNIANTATTATKVSLNVNSVGSTTVKIAAGANRDIQVPAGAIVEINASATVASTFTAYRGEDVSTTAVPANSALSGSVSVRP